MIHTMADLSVEGLFAVWLGTSQELQAAFLDVQRTLLSHAALAVYVPALQAGLNTRPARELLKADATCPCASVEGTLLFSSIEAQQVHQNLLRRLRAA